MQLRLDGPWEFGPGRAYSATVTVPGLAGQDPKRMADGMVWYRRRVDLPGGDWTHATLILSGARFRPAAHVDGVLADHAEGGMGRVELLLAPPLVAPGRSVALEIALASLADVPIEDASRIPGADSWRSNLASCLWDGVALRLHGPARLRRLFGVAVGRGAVEVRFAWERLAHGPGEVTLEVEIVDGDGAVVARGAQPAAPADGALRVALPPGLRRWSPESPYLHRLRARLVADGRTLDADECALGLREIAIDGLGLRLDGAPLTLRAGTVVWHRFVRDPEGRELAWDVAWFERHIVRRLKAHGANTLRFHLGQPPEALLDLCDRHGLLVQAEWSFFHGLQASRASCARQWRAWIDSLRRHPCLALVHPWNETDGEELATGFGALDDVLTGEPPLLVSHRDILHVHKYWWSLFENVGCYYDSAAQFPQPVMADEFGGNYLDGEGVPGGYPTLKEACLRFLGHGHDAAQRIQLQVDASARVAEYWRRLGVAGYSPFCILGSWEDGNHHFLGTLRDGRPKPVWDALTASYAPRAASLDVWDRNFRPGQPATAPLHWFNDTAEPADLAAELRVVDEAGGVRWSRRIVRRVGAHGRAVDGVELPLPADAGRWRLEAELVGAQPGVERPVVSAWRVQTLAPRVPERLRGSVLAIAPDEAELRAFAAAHGFRTVTPGDAAATHLVGSRATWEAVAAGGALASALAATLERGVPAALLDIGPRELGQGYLPGGDLGPLQGAMAIAQAQAVEVALPLGLRVRFAELPEPESCLHPPLGGSPLFAGIDREATRLWNGLRGGLLAPARDLEPLGLARDALLALWTARGADPAVLAAGGPCTAYELCGQYAFSAAPDPAVEKALQAKVRFLAEDAPALAAALTPNARPRCHDLAAQWHAAAHGRARALTPLALCGRALVRCPVVRVDFAPGQGALALSQLLTAGRLHAGFGADGHYGIRPDPAAQQLVLNLLASLQ